MKVKYSFNCLAEMPSTLPKLGAAVFAFAAFWARADGAVTTNAAARMNAVNLWINEILIIVLQTKYSYTVGGLARIHA